MAANLTPGELKKPNGQTKEARIDILKDAVKNGTALPLVDGREVVFANIKENIAAIDLFKTEGKTFQLKLKTGNTYVKTTDIAKSPIFGGGGGGAGGGTEQTAIVEAMQCVYCQAMLDNPNKDFAFISKPSVLKKAYAKCEVGGTTFDQIKDMDAAWHMSAFLGGELLISKNYINKNHVFHRDSAAMQQIYKNKDIAFKNSNQDKLTHDKWNPGDIWAIEKNFKVEKMNTTSIVKYNAEVLNAFKKRKCVGISLKKVVRNAKIKEYNATSKRPGDFTFIKTSASGKTARSSFFSNKAGSIIYSDGVMEIRTNAAMSTSKAEIMGKTARGGGAGWGPIIDIIKLELKKDLPNNSALVNDAKAIAGGNKQKIKTFFTMAKKIDSTFKEKEFNAELAKQSLEWIHAKYSAVWLMFLIQSAPKPKASNIVNSIVNYAASQSKESSVFLKVYE